MLIIVMGNFYHLDLSGPNSFFGKPEFWILEDKSKQMIGPFESELQASEYIGWKLYWPRPRIIRGVTAYGLGSRDWQNSLGDDWVRVGPEIMPRGIRRPRMGN